MTENPEKLRILFAAANPLVEKPLDFLYSEFREIKQSLRNTPVKDRIELLPPALACRPIDLMRDMDDSKPHIVHFSGHGTDTGELVFEDDNAKPKPADKEVLSLLFKQRNVYVKGVVLNACFSLRQAEELIKRIDFAVGMKSEISDGAAIAFAVSFYEAISKRKSLQDSFDDGKTSMAFYDASEKDNAELLCKKGVDPTEYYLLPPLHKTTDKNISGVEDEIGRVIQNLPYPSLGGLFKGRGKELKEIGKRLVKKSAAAITQPHAIHGLGGIGKTRLAVEYAWRAIGENRYGAVLYVVGDSPENLDTNLASLAAPEILNLPEHGLAEQPGIVTAVLRELERRDSWLLIIDNADTKEAAEKARKLLSRLARGHVIITSRRSNWPGEIAGFEIKKLGEADAAAYLLERTKGTRDSRKDDETLARKLARELDGLPIALEQAGAYISKRRIGFKEYLEDFGRERKQVLSWRDAALQKYPAPVLAAWQTTEKQLGPDARAILRLLSFLSPEDIPSELFESRPEKIAEAVKLLSKEEDKKTNKPLARAGGDVREILSELAEWSMIGLKGDRITIHRLVQESVRLRIPDGEKEKWCRAALETVDDYIPADPPPHDVRSWPLWMVMDTHVAAIVKHADESGIPEPTARLMNELGIYCWQRVRYTEAERLFRRALEIDEASLGPDHPNVAIFLNNLAALLRETNRREEAAPMYHRVLKICEKSYGQNDPRVATALNNLAGQLRETNRLEEAEPMFRRALKIVEASLGPDHPDVATDLNNLADLLRETNRREEAEPMFRRSLKIDEAAYGPDHPNVAIRLNNLAFLFKETNRHKEAEPMYQRVLKIFDKSYGQNDPRVATALNNLAELLRETNRREEAEPMFRRALKIDEASFGPDHPNVAIDLNNLALLLRETNRREEAAPMYRRALKIVENSYGPDHPSTITVRWNLEILLKEMEKK